MTQPSSTHPAPQGEGATTLIEAVKALVKSELAPISSEIDQQGRYPVEFLRRLGELGGFSASIPATQGGEGFGLATQIAITTEVGRECGSTAFLVWCQSSCARYLQQSPNDAVRERYFSDVLSGRLLSGTGMSNAVKHLAGIENIHLKARREQDAYVVSGSLPWVSNVGEDHLAIVAAAVESGGYVMMAVRGDAEGVTLRPCPEFAGLEGTQTLNIRLKDVRIPADSVLAHPEQFSAYLKSIKPGFVLGQVGMGFGVIEGSLRTIRESNVTTAHVNQFLDDQGEDLERAAQALWADTRALAHLVDTGKARVLDVLRLRLAASELTLKTANSAMLHIGAKGYLMRHPAQRRLREAVFVAIVTPALKHLRKEIHALEQAAREEQAA
ncbi:MAG: acyl-CoA/acyl-ACP dehydrogenase [Alcaligenaceae bacterium]|nr:acyl-CoA/acyl-ACP dehydrogenase [Alcaligenaceae bacterium]